MLLSLMLVSADARAKGSLADRITEHLCYPESATAMTLGARDSTAYRQAKTLTGIYRDIQGSDARAWFEKTPNGAVCRTPATSDLSLYFCAEVTHADVVLKRHPRRLCP